MFFLLLLCSFSFSQEQGDKNENNIVEGKGWGIVVINSTKKEVEKVIGKGEARSKYDDVYFIDYPNKGIQISYTNKDDKVYAIFFYNNQKRYEHFKTLDVKTDKGTSWTASPEEVINVYGNPKNHYKDDEGGKFWQRIVYEGIDFLFKQNKLVRISIPAR